MRRRVRIGDEQGLATLWVLAGCLLLLAVAAAALTLAQVVLLRHHLSSAADNAALAAAHAVIDGDGCRAAGRVAAANGVRLDRCGIEARGSAVQVQVSAPAPGLVARVVPRLFAQALAGPAGAEDGSVKEWVDRSIGSADDAAMSRNPGTGG